MGYLSRDRDREFMAMHRKMKAVNQLEWQTLLNILYNLVLTYQSLTDYTFSLTYLSTPYDAYPYPSYCLSFSPPSYIVSTAGITLLLLFFGNIAFLLASLLLHLLSNLVGISSSFLFNTSPHSSSSLAFRYLRNVLYRDFLIYAYPF